METPDVIYLIDMGDEIVWHDEPTPEPGMDEADAVKYVRADLIIKVEEFSNEMGEK